MAILIVDANVIVGDPYLRLRRWKLLAGAVEAGTVRILIPTIAVREAVARHLDSPAKTMAEIQSLRGRVSPEVALHLAAATQAARVEMDAYEGALKARLEQLHFATIDTPQVDLEQLAARAIERRRPFDGKGNGFRDALLWASVLDLIGGSPDEEIVLLSNDRRAFASEAGGLDRDLAEEAEGLLVSGSMALATKLDEVIVPGRYRGEPIQFQLGDELGPAIRERMAGFSRHAGLNPDPFGFQGIDYVEIHRMGMPEILDATARRLNDTVALEVVFDARVNAELDLTYVGLDISGEPRQMEATEWRQLRLPGRARVDLDQQEILSIDSMSMSLNTSPYIPPTREAGGVWEVRPERQPGTDLDKQVPLWDVEQDDPLPN